MCKTMKISGYVLEELVGKMEADFAQGLSELAALLKRYADDAEAKDIAQRLEKADEKERKAAIEEMKELAHLRKLENSGASGSLPFGDYRRKETPAQTR